MSDLSDLKCPACDVTLERVRYFPRQLLTADDLSAEQAYHRETLRRHNRHLLGWGVACGCAVEPVDAAGGWQVRVGPGYAVSPAGDEIVIADSVDLDLQLGVQDQPCTVNAPCPPLGEMPALKDGSTVAYVAVRYAECYSRPVRVPPTGCGCDEAGCEYSRVREAFEVKLLWQLPESHRRAAREDLRWCEKLRDAPQELLRELLTYPAPSCPACETDPWVVLATVKLPKKRGRTDADAKDPDTGLDVSYKDRRVLLSAQRLQVALLCLPR